MYSCLSGTSALAKVLLTCKRVTARAVARGEQRGGRTRATLLSPAMNDLSLARWIIWARINYTLLLKTKRASVRAHRARTAEARNAVTVSPETVARRESQSTSRRKCRDTRADTRTQLLRIVLSKLHVTVRCPIVRVDPNSESISDHCYNAGRS